jgi:hypothetical protein
MALLGGAAMVLSLDVTAESVAEHDHWHTHEHLPERLSIPGFLRGSRWTALSGRPRYFILYEVAELEVLTSAAYRERLNHPTPWTAKMMQSYRGMARGFCRVECSLGAGVGHVALLIKLAPAPAKGAMLQGWLVEDELPQLASRRGLASAQLLQAAAKPEMTAEQRIRGQDAALEWVLLVTGYDVDSVTALLKTFSSDQLERHGAAPGALAAIYQLDYSLSATEIAMASAKQKAAARRNIKKAASAARKKRSIAQLPKKTRSALGKQGAKVAKQKRKARR